MLWGSTFKAFKMSRNWVYLIKRPSDMQSVKTLLYRYQVSKYVTLAICLFVESNLFYLIYEHKTTTYSLNLCLSGIKICLSVWSV